MVVANEKSRSGIPANTTIDVLTRILLNGFMIKRMANNAKRIGVKENQRMTKFIVGLIAS